MRDVRAVAGRLLWWPVVLVALVLMGGGVVAAVRGDAIGAGQGLVLGVLALGIGLDLRRRGAGA